MKTKTLAIMSLLVFFSFTCHSSFAEDVVIFSTGGQVNPGETVIFEETVQDSGELRIYFRTEGVLTLGIAAGKQISNWLYQDGDVPSWLVKSTISGEYSNHTEISPGLYQFSIKNSESISIDYEIQVTLRQLPSFANIWEIIGSITIALLTIGIIYYIVVFIKYRFLNRRNVKS